MGYSRVEKVVLARALAEAALGHSRKRDILRAFNVDTRAKGFLSAFGETRRDIGNRIYDQLMDLSDTDLDELADALDIVSSVLLRESLPAVSTQRRAIVEVAIEQLRAAREDIGRVVRELERQLDAGSDDSVTIERDIALIRSVIEPTIEEAAADLDLLASGGRRAADVAEAFRIRTAVLDRIVKVLRSPVGSAGVQSLIRVLVQVGPALSGTSTIS